MCIIGLKDGYQVFGSRGGWIDWIYDLFHVRLVRWCIFLILGLHYWLFLELVFECHLWNLKFILCYVFSSAGILRLHGIRFPCCLYLGIAMLAAQSVASWASPHWSVLNALSLHNLTRNQHLNPSLSLFASPAFLFNTSNLSVSCFYTSGFSCYLLVITHHLEMCFSHPPLQTMCSMETAHSMWLGQNLVCCHWSPTLELIISSFTLGTILIL